MTSLYLVGERVLDVVDLGEDGVGDGGGEGEEPERRDDLARPPQPRHGVRVQRVADRQVPEEGVQTSECHSIFTASTNLTHMRYNIIGLHAMKAGARMG